MTMTRTINLKIGVTGNLSAAHPSARPGPARLIYAITGVPQDIPLTEVLRIARSVAFVHSNADMAGWTYGWSEIAHLKPGAIINRYKKVQPAHA